MKIIFIETDYLMVEMQVNLIFKLICAAAVMYGGFVCSW